jgi:N utilization substance protein B
MLSRKKTRELLMQLLYQMAILDVYERSEKECFLSLHEEDYPDGEPDSAYFDRLLSLILDHLSLIDETIDKASDNWKIRRISKVDLSILRVAVAEILFASDIPHRVSANEAVELAKKYGSDNSAKFINGLLGNITRKPPENAVFSPT